MKFSQFRLKNVLVRVAVVALAIAASIGIMKLFPLFWGYQIGTPQYEVADRLYTRDFSYKTKNGVIFAVRNHYENQAVNFLELMNQRHVFEYGIDPQTTRFGRGTHMLGFNNGGDLIFVKQVQDKTIVSVPLAEFPFRKDSTKPMIDLSKVRIYDNSGNNLDCVSGVDTALYFDVLDEFPEDYRVYMEYEGRDYLLIDTNNPSLGFY